MDQELQEVNFHDSHDATGSKHDRCLCEDCLIQGFSYFGHFENALEKRPKRKSVTSIEEAYKNVFKESRLDDGPTAISQPMPWCPSLGDWEAIGTTWNLYSDMFLRYAQDRGKRFLWLNFLFKGRKWTEVLFFHRLLAIMHIISAFTLLRFRSHNTDSLCIGFLSLSDMKFAPFRPTPDPARFAQRRSVQVAKTCWLHELRRATVTIGSLFAMLFAVLSTLRQKLALKMKLSAAKRDSGMVRTRVFTRARKRSDIKLIRYVPLSKWGVTLQKQHRAYRTQSAVPYG